MTLYRPNYRRARKLALEIESAKFALEEAREKDDAPWIETLLEDIQHLEREFFMCGVSSEYEL